MVSTVQFGRDGKDARSDVAPTISHAKLFVPFEQVQPTESTLTG
jgi:hypothetical protein